MKHGEPIEAMMAAPVTPLAAAQAERKKPPGVEAADPLVEAGCLDVTKAPYLADPSGKKDSTAASQRAVNDARDS